MIDHHSGSAIPTCPQLSWKMENRRKRKTRDGEAMKIVTYNVNGLRQRISQFGSLLKLLDSFDADIICFQETKLRRQELTADLAMADGYESFFSCTRTCEKGRMGYSGVATFCRVKSAFSSHEVALPVVAEEGFTGLLENSRAGKDEVPGMAKGLEEFARDELLKVDNEGRCVITDHGHFVVFNVYGPRAQSDDPDRIQFKLKFFQILQKRWEYLLDRGRRIFVVGDLNIAPAAIDRCDAGPDFEKNEFRQWFRSILLDHGGSFFDVFRAKHADRREAYTCWPSNTGAEQFNYGTRIDHILFSGSCLHQEKDQKDHNFVTCHVNQCDILTQYKRLKPENAPRWKGGWNSKLEGSDHVPIYANLSGIPDVLEHSTPTLASRYLPMIHGRQQTLVSVLMKRQVAKQVKSFEVSSLSMDESIVIKNSCERVKRSLDDACPDSSITQDECRHLERDSEGATSEIDEKSGTYATDIACKISLTARSENVNSMSRDATKKKSRKSQGSQLSLRSFFQKCPNFSNSVNTSADTSTDQTGISMTDHQCTKTPITDDDNSNSSPSEMKLSLSTECQDEQNCSSLKEKNNIALQEWQRIQQVMQNSIPLCRGHNEPCVARVVKKQGPTFGRRFYVCARAEGPASNPEANCGYFKWAPSKFWEK